jgi:hypothetical protein
MFKTVSDGHDVLSRNLAQQGQDFQAVVQKLTGLIEDDKRKGTVPSLVRKILDISPVKVKPQEVARSDSVPFSTIAPVTIPMSTQNLEKPPQSVLSNGKKPLTIVHKSARIQSKVTVT